MIRRSFILFPGIGLHSESRLWSQGVCDWRGLCDIPARRSWVDLADEIAGAEMHYAMGHTWYFYDRLPQAERWRIIGEFENRTAYLDIEVDGCGRYSVPTVIGVCRQGKFTSFVRGINMTRENLSSSLQGVEVLVTYNGRRHDMHFIRKLLPENLKCPRIVDLRYVAKRAGFSGGLKEVERGLGVRRSRYVELAATGQATRLWRLWNLGGSRAALNLLRAYNREDTCNLSPIAIKLRAILKERIVPNVV